MSASAMDFTAFCSPSRCPTLTKMSVSATDRPSTCTQLVERALPTKCSLFTSCRGPFPTVSATKWPDMQICNQSQSPVHAPRIPEDAHVDGPYKESHECAVSWEVTYDLSIVDTGRRTPELAGTPPPLGPGPDNAQTGRERDEKRQRTEPIDESPGDGGADVRRPTPQSSGRRSGAGCVS